MSERYTYKGHNISVYSMGGFWYAQIDDERGLLVDLLGGFYAEETARARATQNVDERTDSDG